LPHDPELHRHLPENLNPAYAIGQIRSMLVRRAV